MGKITIQDLPIKRVPMPTYKIDASWTYLEKLIENWTNDYGWEMNPDFQRGHVWTQHQQIRYIEYVLEGGYSGKDIYLNSANWEQGKPGTLQTVDGLQRITAVRDFLKNKFKIYKKYQYKNFKYLRDLQCRLHIYVNSLSTRQEVLKWYLELNAGGTPHSSSEIARVQKLLKETQSQTND